MEQKLILVHYIFVGERGVSREKVIDNLTRYHRRIVKQEHENYVFPIHDEDKMRIECINPVLFKEEDFAAVTAKLDEARADMKKFLEENKTEQA